MWPFCIRKPCPRIHVRSGMRLPLTAPLGNSIPLRSQIPGRSFRQSPQPETASHSKGEFRDTLSETPSIRKARPTLNTSSERMRVCRPGRSRHRGNGKCHPRRLPRLRLQVSRKKPREFRGFHICIVLHEGPRTAKLLSQHGLLGGCSHVVQIFLGGMVLRGNPVVEQHLIASVVGILLEHGLVALLDRGPILPGTSPSPQARHPQPNWKLRGR